MRRFFSPPEKFSDSSVTLDESETRHLRDVLRLKPGDSVNVFDGEGREFECRVDAIQKRSTDLSILKGVDPTAPESILNLTVCAAILKGDKTDFAIQKLVELGVNHFVPMLTVRCDVKPKDAAKRVTRWRKIAFEAAKQCGRAKLMLIDEVAKFEDALQKPEMQKPASSERGHITSMSEAKILFSERDGESFKIETPPTSITAFLGPEGGWDDSELDLAKQLNVPVFTLHGRIMKADTAAIAISAILQHRFGDLN
jgi:16S rRNA (uracil1498-N3)-methyltransferase